MTFHVSPLPSTRLARSTPGVRAILAGQAQSMSIGVGACSQHCAVRWRALVHRDFVGFALMLASALAHVNGR
jgi:hypothetical protein